MGQARRHLTTLELRRRLGVYVLTDRQAARGRPQLALVAAALRGGATAVQLRDKTASGRELHALARGLAELCAARGALFLVNDRLDVALACGADGVHLGLDDLPAAAARVIAGPDFVIGASAATPAEVAAAEAAGADYVGVGPVFATGSKGDAGEPIGPEGLAAVARSAGLPVVAIGGLGADNAHLALEAGAAGVAVISAVMGAVDVTGACERLAHAVRSAQAGMGR